MNALPANSSCVLLRGVSVPIETDVGRAFVADCARHTEGLLTKEEVQAKWQLTDQQWAELAENPPLLHAVRAEREHRISKGQAATEAAHRQFAKAPNILGDILSDREISPRHRIEAARELRAVVTAGTRDDVDPEEKITITINLGADEKKVIELPMPSRVVIDGEVS